MEQEPPKLMTPFDCQTTPQWIYMLKLMLPYTPDSIQKFLAVFIRFQEMQFTIQYFQNSSKTKAKSDVPSPDNIFTNLKPYMDPSTQEMMDQMESMMSMMEMIQMMQENPENTSSQSSDFNPMDFLAGFSGSDLSSIFNMKGDSSNE